MHSKTYRSLKAALSILLSLALCAVIFPVFPAAAADTSLTGLQTEYLENPIGIDVQKPRLRWQMTSAVRGQMQTAYQIVVAGDPEKAASGTGDVWDSGKIISRQSYDVLYDGPPLSSKTRYYWSVRVWDKDGRATAYAAAAYFETAMLNPADWSADWITVEDETAALYPRATVDLAPTAARYVKLDCTKLGIPLDGDGYRVQLAEIEVLGQSGRNLALGCKVSSNDTFSNGWWEPEFVVDGERSSGTGQNGFTSNGHAGPDANVWLELDLGEVQNIDRVVIYARNDVKSPQGEKTANFPVSYTVQTAGEDRDFTVGFTADGATVPEFKAYDASLPVFGKSFRVEKEVESARAYVSGPSMFEMSLNGRAATDAVFEPGETNFDKRALYVTYDITDLLVQGANTVSAFMGKGFYYNAATPGRYNRSPKIWGPLMFLAQLEITYADGSVQTVGTDTSWKYTKGPLTESSWLGGEDYDANRELTGLAQPDYGFDGWQTALPVEALPFETLSARMYPSLRVTETLEEPAVTELPGGGYVVDFGLNFAGTFTFTGELAAGQRVEFWPGETLNADGTVSQQSIGNGPVWDSYTAAGGGMSYTPKFVYHGFRYLEVRGLTEKPDASQFAGNIIHCDNGETGDFTTSDPVINQIHTLITRSISDNMYNVLTDCPHREKLGWMEVSQLLFNSIAANYDVAAWYENYAGMIMDAQKDYGSYPSVVPPLTAGHGAHMLRPGPDDTPNDPTWTGAGVLIPWQLYKTYGNIAKLREAYGSMTAYMDYLAALVEKNEPYILESEDVNRDLGDWYAEEPTTVTFVISCTYFQLCDVMGQIASLTGHSSDARKYKALAGNVKDAVNKEFFHPDSLSYDTGSQTANGLPLCLGMAPAEYEEGILESLVASIKARGYHLSSGEVGLKYVLQVLSDRGYADVAYRMVTNRTMPSYYYLASIGKTSLTEPWDGRTTDSQNHCMLGHGEGWLYAYLGGLQNAGTGYDESVVAPYIPDDLTSADVSVGTPYGQLRSTWTRDGGHITLETYVPANTVSAIHIPAKSLDVVTEGGKPLDEAEGVLSAEYEDGEAVVRVGSGHYSFSSERVENLYPEKLESLLDTAKGLQKEYVTRHYIALQEGIKTAEAVLAGASTQKALDGAAADLSALLSTLRFKGNLGLGKPVEALSSIENADWSAANLTDGDREHGPLDSGAGYSSSSNEYDPHAEAVTVDLLAVSRIGRVVLYPRHMSGPSYAFPKDFTIDVSADGETWETVVSETDFPPPAYGAVPFTFEEREARYVRLHASALWSNPIDTGRYRLQLAEFEIYDDIPQTLDEAVENGKANLTDLIPDNELTAETVMDAVSQGMVREGMTAAWTKPFDLRKATGEAAGSVTGRISLTLDGTARTIDINLSIPQLPQSLGSAKAAVESALKNLTATNDTAEADILAAAKQAVTNGAITASVTAFQKTEAGKQDGSLAVTLVLDLEGNTVEIKADWIIPKAVIKGDVNGDGDVDISDVMALCKVLARKSAGQDPTRDEIARGDLTGEGDVTITDVMALCKILAKKT